MSIRAPPLLIPGPNDHQRVATTRWWVSLPLPRSSRPNESFDSLGGFPCPSQALSTTNESLRLVGGPSSPSFARPRPKRPPTSRKDSLVGIHAPPSLVPGPNDHQRVVATCWWVSLPVHPSTPTLQPPTSQYDSMGGFTSHPGPINHQRVVMTRWAASSRPLPPLHPRHNLYQRVITARWSFFLKIIFMCNFIILYLFRISI